MWMELWSSVVTSKLAWCRHTEIYSMALRACEAGLSKHMSQVGVLGSQKKTVHTAEHCGAAFDAV